MPKTHEPLRVALVGVGYRAVHSFLPVLRALPDRYSLAGVWSRAEKSARAFGEAQEIPWFTDLDALVEKAAPDLAIVSVAAQANGAVGLAVIERGLHMLADTPIALDLAEADAIIEAADSRGLKIEIAEEFHRHPLEQIKLAMIQSGVFGRVHTAFNEFCCHGYHGASILRSYLGFPPDAVQVTGAVRQPPLGPYKTALPRIGPVPEETQEHGTIEFSDGRLGIYHWSNVGYTSPLRWWRGTRFLAEKGMGVGLVSGPGMPGVGPSPGEHEWLTILDESGSRPLFITLEERRSGAAPSVLDVVIAHTGDPSKPLVVWENPFQEPGMADGPHGPTENIAIAGCLESLRQAILDEVEPTYGPVQGRLDQELTLAIQRAGRSGGGPVRLPLERESSRKG